jgi:hypothetical protein
MRRYLPVLALFVVYACINMAWQYKMTREIERLQREAVTHDQMVAWAEHLARENETTVVVPEF